MSRDKTSLQPISAKRPAADDEDEETHTAVPSARRKRAKRDSSAHRTPGQTPTTRIVLKTKMDQTLDTTSPAPPGAGHPILSQYGTGSPAAGHSSTRRPRPLTQHQLAVEQNRRKRVDYVISRRRAEIYDTLRARRRNELPFVRTGRLLQKLPADYDTDDESSWGKGGLCPNPEDEEDYGEAAGFYLSVVRKVARRLQRWDWYSIAAGDKGSPDDGLGEGYRNRALNGPPEREPEPQPPSSTAKPRGRGGRRKQAAETGPEGDKPAAPPKRASRRRNPEGGGAKRSRARPSKGGAASTNATPKRNGSAGNKAPDTEPTAAKSAPRHEEDDNTLDDFDKELLGELSANEEAHHRSPTPAAPRSPTSRYTPVDGLPTHRDISNLKRDAIQHKLAISQSQDSDDITEDEFLSSAVGASNGHSPAPSSALDTTHVDDDGDETMLEA